ncbi:hypothetical protein AV530_018654 [Patagioenas fasciata monilis]|uniref:Uncharacterized protein n=1 Tax=Patagioenas fasciata monilis TaxID=372326 RepID=A0A1V4JK44_PATFA|nr:hypothetical protein AV530_018654 [Patagioenas fasciata monilis]
MEGISSILHSGLRQTFGPAASEKQYLNTVIPYEKKGSPPSVEDLQMLTNSECSFQLPFWGKISWFASRDVADLGCKHPFCVAWGVLS